MATLLTYLGHASFKLETPEGKIFYLDAWLKENPRCPEELKTVTQADAFLVSHGHGDHLEPDLPEIATRTGATVVAPSGVVIWLWQKGFRSMEDINTSGTVNVAGVDVTMVQAIHFAHVEDMLQPHEPCGYILRAPGMPTIYFAGDTGIFGDMKLIGEMYKPDIAILPIGGRYTMGPYEAAWAAGLVGAPTVIPMHYATFPALPGTPEEFLGFLKPEFKAEVMQPGETLKL